MIVTFLGTGTSHGIPVIDCNCKVCKSTNIKNNRTRSSIYIETDNKTNILIDTSLDFRQQALREKIIKPDAVLFTHDHADHLFGLDDLRIWTSESPINIYCDDKTQESIKTKYSYIFDNEKHIGGGIPNFKLNLINTDFVINENIITPIKIYHGLNPILGYRIGKFAYITDCKSIPQESIDKLKGVEILVVNALKFSQHPTHMSVDDAIELINKIAPKKSYLTHICHCLEHETLKNYLPKHIEPSYDSLKIII